MTKRGLVVFSLEEAEDDATLYSRMFGFGVIEDPATGNASGPVGAGITAVRVGGGSVLVGEGTVRVSARARPRAFPGGASR
jgi:hypothetical protein